ncbi:hypothetical protein T484DRAFT_1860526 [Baffinella frigidus]|nr:hypothetical protein T484DRAFT_1860526 [Cryptophyta sp. CCMP2293]
MRVWFVIQGARGATGATSPMLDAGTLTIAGALMLLVLLLATCAVGARGEERRGARGGARGGAWATLPPVPNL